MISNGLYRRFLPARRFRAALLESPAYGKFGVFLASQIFTDGSRGAACGATSRLISRRRLISYSRPLQYMRKTNRDRPSSGGFFSPTAQPGPLPRPADTGLMVIPSYAGGWGSLEYFAACRRWAGDRIILPCILPLVVPTLDRRGFHQLRVKSRRGSSVSTLGTKVSGPATKRKYKPNLVAV